MKQKCLCCEQFHLNNAWKLLAATDFDFSVTGGVGAKLPKTPVDSRPGIFFDSFKSHYHPLKNPENTCNLERVHTFLPETGKEQEGAVNIDSRKLL
ncbi:hypothetical protein CDAR_300111 [Caerostris darwini]|uniref:Uncharacterized protein n=1 Tax=Caerostris darwini TaxID=1538125 RepID=A0AAV4W5G2_9ARAC|nr:hypothetical protein CDAR_300111 [Caerostris darwini]